MKFIQVTGVHETYSGKVAETTHYLNVAHIVLIRKNGNGTADIATTIPTLWIHTKESYVAVQALIAIAERGD